MDMGLAMVVLGVLMIGGLVLLVLALYWVIRLGVRHGTGDVHRQRSSAHEPARDSADRTH